MSPFTIYGAIALIAALLGSIGAWEVRGWECEAGEKAQIVALGKQKLQAGATLAAETAKTAAAEQLLADSKNKQDLTDAKLQKANESLSASLRSAAGPAGRLRDPKATGCGRSGGSTSTPLAAVPGAGAGDGADAAGLLSAELTELLLKQAKAADLINDAYASCRADADAVRR